MNKEELFRILKKKGFKIIQWNGDFRRNDSLWYPSGHVLLEVKKEGIFSVEVHGDVEFFIREEEFKNVTLEELTPCQRKQIKEGKADFENNNWIEVLRLDEVNGEKVWVPATDVVGYTLDEIPALLESALESVGTVF